MSILDSMGNECSQGDLDLIYSMGERCPEIPSMSGVLTPPELIKLARWCVSDGVVAPDLTMARAAFPTLRYRSDGKVNAALDFLKTDPEVAAALRG